MKKLLIFFISFFFICFISSCESDEGTSNGENKTFGLIAIIAVIVAIIIYFQQKVALDEEKKLAEDLKEKEVAENFAVPTEKYVGGHPEIDCIINNTWLIPTNEVITIQQCREGVLQLYKDAINEGTIPTNKIKNLKIEDASSIEKKVTLGRFILLGGIGALAFKKKVKHEAAYLTIEWDDERFDHETTFEFNGKNAFQKANQARNRLIKICRNQTAF